MTLTRNTPNTALEFIWDTPGYVGTAAVAHVRSCAERLGENADAIMDAIRNDTPAGRMILKLLGLQRSDVIFKNRPPDPLREQTIYAVVSQLVWEGASLQEAFKTAPALLADPNRRASRGAIGDTGLKVLGKFRNGDVHHLSPRAVRDAYWRYRKQGLANRYFVAVDETPFESAQGRTKLSYSDDAA
ncbi:hypothetical protein GCM10007036_16240 [Alsobacter metallidurans]|uniref:Uncharacterized protein n=2 Tax=Alsobacter metallidurans TaxID=340221 RepID=A0A917MHM6_9HYPH|nr:hypothetical protein GCM10007036_16240 [Alsobacter metallidurans]